MVYRLLIWITIFGSSSYDWYLVFNGIFWFKKSRLSKTWLIWVQVFVRRIIEGEDSYFPSIFIVLHIENAFKPFNHGHNVRRAQSFCEKKSNIMLGIKGANLRLWLIVLHCLNIHLFTFFFPQISTENYRRRHIKKWRSSR